MKLTEKQREAVESRGRREICVIAGPGSGKTTVLVNRFRWLVEFERVDPEQILAITFTRKAALSMKQRLVAPYAGDDDKRRRFERAQVSTIHAFCARLLREHALEAGIDPDFQQIEEADADLELRQTIEETLDAAYREDPGAAIAFLRSFRDSNSWSDEGGGSPIHAQLRNLIESARSWGKPLTTRDFGDPDYPNRRWITGVAARALEAYQAKKKARALLDFSDLEAETVKLLEKAELELRTPFRHILLDENQDTNPLQAELVTQLVERCRDAGPTLFAVGDLNQSIYAFRNAEPGVFRRFREQVGRNGHVVDLLENFRSRTEILQAVEMANRGADGVTEHTLVARKATFVPKTGPSVEALLVKDVGENPAAVEAAWIARRILELRETLELSGRAGDSPQGTVPDSVVPLYVSRKPRWRDFAVLVRTNGLLTTVADGLRAAGIPYQLNAGRSFFQAEEVRDLLALLKTLDNPRDEISLAAVLRSPLAGLSDETLLRLKADNKVDLSVALANPPALPAAQAERVEAFRALLERLRAERERTPLNVLLARTLAATGYEAWLMSREGGLQRAANVEKLARLAERASESGALSFRAGLERLEAMSQSGTGEQEASVAEEAADSVHVLTVHMAKGLEYPVVFLASAQNPGRRDSDSLLFHPDHGVGARWADPAEKDGRKDPAYEAIHVDKKELDRAESDRIFYVAVTRAEEHLVLSASWKGAPRKTGWAKQTAQLIGDKAFKAPPGAPQTIDRHGLRVRVQVVAEAPEPRSAEEEAAARRAAEPERLEVRNPGGQADSEASVTAVSLFAECPRRYYLSRYLRLDPATAVALPTEEDAPERDVDLDAGELGSQVHAALAGETDRVDAEAAELVEVFRQSPLGARAAAAEKVERELELLFPVEGRLLRGRIDLLFEDAEGRVLLDYKTDRVSEREARERGRGYGLQLQLYALALAGRGEPVDRAVLHFLRPDAVVEVDLSETALREARRRAAAFFDAQERLEFPLDVGAHCWSCPHLRKACPAEPLAKKAKAPADGGQFRLEF